MARAQIPFIIQTTAGDAVAGASVQINIRGGGAATVYAAETGTSVLANPVTTDANGYIEGWLDEGSYTFTASGANIATFTRSVEIVNGSAPVVTAKIADSAISTAKLADLSVSTAKLAAGAVTTSKIGDLQVTTGKLADLATTTAKLADLAVTTAKVADLNITTGKLADLSVTEAKVAAAAVSTAKLANGSVTNDKLGAGAVSRDKLAALLQEALVPVGSILTYAGGTAPSGWFICDGSEKDIATYGDLYNVLSTTYGALTNGAGAPGTTHFRLPDLRDRVGVGASATIGRGATGGAKTVALSITHMPSHNHGGATGTGTTGGGTTGGMNRNNPHRHGQAGYTTTSYNSNTGGPWVIWGPGNSHFGDHMGTADINHEHSIPGLSVPALSISSQGSGTAHENMQPYLGVNYIIKY